MGFCQMVLEQLSISATATSIFWTTFLSTDLATYDGTDSEISGADLETSYDTGWVTFFGRICHPDHDLSGHRRDRFYRWWGVPCTFQGSGCEAVL